MPRSGWRLALVTPVAGMDRLAVALPAEDRTLRAGRVDVLSTLPASAHLVVRRAHGGPVVADLRVPVAPGTTAIAVPGVGASDVYDIRVDAVTADGRVATAQMAVVPGTTLSRSVRRRLIRLVDVFSSGQFPDFETGRCHRVALGAFACRWRYAEEDMRSGTGPPGSCCVRPG